MAAHQAPPSLGFSRQEHWSGLPFLSPSLGLDTFIYTFKQAFVQDIVIEYLVGAKVYSEKRAMWEANYEGNSVSERFSFSTSSTTF